MKISEEKYKYLYMVDYLKKRLKRGEQTEIAKKMNMDSQAISGILNGSRVTNIEKIREIAQVMGMNSIEIEALEKEAAKKAYENRFGENLEKCNELDLEDEFKKVVFSLEKNLTESDKDEILNFIKFKANK